MNIKNKLGWSLLLLLLGDEITAVDRRASARLLARTLATTEIIIFKSVSRLIYYHIYYGETRAHMCVCVCTKKQRRSFKERREAKKKKHVI